MKRLKEKLIYWLAKNFLPVVDEKDVLVIKDKRIYIGGKEVENAEYNLLCSEAHILKSMRLWDLIVNDLNCKAQKKMYKDAVDITGLLFGKTVLYTLDVQTQIVDKLAKLKS